MELPGSTVGAKDRWGHSGERDEADQGGRRLGSAVGHIPTQREAGVRAVLPRSFCRIRSTPVVVLTVVPATL